MISYDRSKDLFYYIVTKKKPFFLFDDVYFSPLRFKTFCNILKKLIKLNFGKSGVYNLGSNNSFMQPIDMFSHTALIFSPNVWLWKSARYQPFIGMESFFIQHSGTMGIDPMSPAIYTSQAMNPYSSFLVNLEYGLLVNQFKVSYRWVKFNMYEDIANNSINPDSYSIPPIRHLEVVWQFWN